MKITKKIINQWNKLLTREEEIVLVIPESLENNTKLYLKQYQSYQRDIEQLIHLSVNQDKKLMLKKRAAFIDNLFALKCALAGIPTKGMPKQNQTKHIKTLVRNIDKHRQYIKENAKKLNALELAEDHFFPIIYDILAESYDYLAVSKWNSISGAKPKEIIPKLNLVINYYQKRLSSLQLERDTLAERSPAHLEQRMYRTRSELREAELKIKELKCSNFAETKVADLEKPCNEMPLSSLNTLNQFEQIKLKMNKSTQQNKCNKMLLSNPYTLNQFKRIKLKMKEPGQDKSSIQAFSLSKSCNS